jgi:hypothetical protein
VLMAVEVDGDVNGYPTEISAGLLKWGRWRFVFQHSLRVACPRSLRCPSNISLSAVGAVFRPLQ